MDCMQWKRSDLNTCETKLGRVQWKLGVVLRLKSCVKLHYLHILEIMLTETPRRRQEHYDCSASASHSEHHSVSGNV